MNKKIPPFHPTGEDMRESGKPVGLGKTTGHQIVRGPDDKILVAVTYKTHRKGMSSITWEREIDLKKCFGYGIPTPGKPMALIRNTAPCVELKRIRPTGAPEISTSWSQGIV